MLYKLQRSGIHAEGLYASSRIEREDKGYVPYRTDEKIGMAPNQHRIRFEQRIEKTLEITTVGHDTTIDVGTFRSRPRAVGAHTYRGSSARATPSRADLHGHIETVAETYRRAPHVVQHVPRRPTIAARLDVV